MRVSRDRKAPLVVTKSNISTAFGTHVQELASCESKHAAAILRNMIKPHGSNKQALSFDVRLEIEEVSAQPDVLILRCELSPGGINAQFAVPFFRARTPYEELAREKIQFRLKYIHQRLDDVLADAVMKLWNESGRETERQTWALKELEKRREFLDSEHTEEVALKEWRRRDRTEVLTGEGYEPRSHGGARRSKTRNRKTRK
jgi:hypothetical protein